MHVLVTGGAGYIGSHTCVSLLEAGHDITVIDNLCNSSEIALERVQEITGKSLTFIRGDIRNPADLDKALSGGVDAVIHFAALKAVGESCEKPLEYFDNNIGGTIILLQAMERAGRTQCNLIAVCQDTSRWQIASSRGYFSEANCGAPLALSAK